MKIKCKLLWKTRGIVQYFFVSSIQLKVITDKLIQCVRIKKVGLILGSIDLPSWIILEGLSNISDTSVSCVGVSVTRDLVVGDAYYVMRLQALCVFHSSLTLARKFLKHFKFEICTMIDEKISCM